MHPVIAKTLARRGFNNLKQIKSFLDPTLYKPTPPDSLPGIRVATKRIIESINLKETILVLGDFDVDGQTSTTILVEAIKELGGKVTYHIPVRATEGHGIQTEILKNILHQRSENIKLLLTCDTGIAAFDAVEFANRNNLDVIITDHHDPPKDLPRALSIINPKLLSQEHPLATLPGVGVAYKLVEALYEEFKKSPNDHPSDHNRKISSERFLDLVALGIIADVAEQLGDTRYLLQKGLIELRSTQRLGLQRIIEFAKIIPSQLDEEDIGFKIAPRLNALGRLSDANKIVEFLTTDNNNRVNLIATQLEELNERRKLLTEQITQAALAQINQDQSLIEQAVIVLAHHGWHSGVIGIVASRMVDRYQKPTIILTLDDNGVAHGSARSIDGIHIADAIGSQKDLLISYGGHPGAAGLSLPSDALPQFKQGLEHAIRNQYGDQIPKPVLHIDAEISLDEITLNFADDIGQLAPFGAGNPKLHLLSRNIKIVKKSKFGNNGNHLQLIITDNAGNELPIIWWNGVGKQVPEPEKPLDLVYSIGTRIYKGEKQLQALWIDFRSTKIIVPRDKFRNSPIEVFDHRFESDQFSKLDSIKSEREVQIWAEGEAKKELEGSDRYDLIPDIPLVVWTIPPGHNEWKDVLERVKPQKLYFFLVNPKLDDPRIFLTRLSGLIKYVIKTKKGITTLKDLVSATCQKEITVEIGIRWLDAKGLIDVIRWEDTTVWLTSGSGNRSQNLNDIDIELKSILKETAAFRNYFKTSYIQQFTNDQSI